MDELRRRRVRRQRRVDLEARFGARLGHRFAEPLLEKGAPVAEPLARERHARRHRMPAALDRDPRFDRRPHRPAEIDAHDRAAGAGRMRPGEGQREGRALEPLLEPRREQADDAGRPSSRPRRPPPRRAPRGRATAALPPRPPPAPRSRSAGGCGSAGRVRSRSSRASMSSVAVRSRTPSAASPMRPPALMRGPMTKPRW